MATNPLQTQVIGGNLEIPTAGVQLATPMLSGPPVTPNRTISDLISMISGVAQAAGNLGNMYLQDKKEMKEASEANKLKLDREELALLQNEANLLKVEFQSKGSIIAESDRYKNFISDLSFKSADETKAPYYRSEASRILAATTDLSGTLKKSEERDAEIDRNRAEAEADKALRAASAQLTNELNLRIVESLPLDPTKEDVNQIFDDIYRTHDYIIFSNPDIATSIETEKARLLRKISEKELAISKEQAENDYINSASLLNYDVEVLNFSDNRIKDFETANRRLSVSKNAIDSYFSDLPSGIHGLDMIEQKREELVSAYMVSSPTAAQKRYRDQVIEHFDKVSEQYTNGLINNSMYTTKSKIANAAVYGELDLLNPEGIAKSLVDSVNDELGSPIVSYADGDFSANIAGQNNDRISNAVRDMYTSLLGDWQKNRPMYDAMERVYNPKNISTVTEEDLKTIKFDPANASIEHIDLITKRMNKGSVGSVFEPFLRDVFENPNRPDGTLREEDFKKAMTIVRNKDVARGMLLNSNTDINDQTTRRIIKADFAMRLQEQKNRLSNFEFREKFGAVLGTSNNIAFDDNALSRFIFSSGENPAGTAGSSNKLDIKDSTILESFKDYPNHNIPGSTIEFLKSIHRIYNEEFGNALNSPKAALEFYKSSLSAFGISMVDNGRSALFLVRDDKGIAAKNPKQTIDKFLDHVPEYGSKLHMTTLGSLLNTNELNEKVLRSSKGMSIRQLYAMYGEAAPTSGELDTYVSSNFKEGPMLQISSNNIDEYSLKDLTNFGNTVNIGNASLLGLKVNSGMEYLVNNIKKKPEPKGLIRW